MNKGFTLLETLLSLAVSNIIIVLLISMMLMYSAAYKNTTKNYKNYFYSTEALMYIGNEVLNSRNVGIHNNRIEINFPDGINKKYILLNGENSLIVNHYKNNEFVGSNNILNDLAEFNVNKKNNTIYVSITLKDGEKYERSFGINPQP